MGTGGGVSAFAAIHGEDLATESLPVSSTKSSTNLLPKTANHFLALSDDPANRPNPPRSVVKLGSDSVRIRLESDESVLVVGLYSLWVKRGRVCLLGASLPASSTLYWVSAPVTHAVPSIVCVSDSAEVVIAAIDNGIRYLGNVSQHFSGIWQPNDVGTALSFHILGYHSETFQDVSKNLRRLTLEDWATPIHGFLRREGNSVPRVVVTGAKGTGKSTFCRVLINKMLTMNVPGKLDMTKSFPEGVLLLDIDPGQPELAAPGIIYLAHVRAPLFGPSFTNVGTSDTAERSMLRMHYLGAYTPRACPIYYQRCIGDLLSLYHHYENMPLIINTCGWNTASGQTVLSSAIRGTRLTDIIQLGPFPNVPLQGVVHSGGHGEQGFYARATSQPYQVSNKTSKDFRQMQLQAYLHASGVVNGHVIWEQPPVTVSYDAFPADFSTVNGFSVIVVLDPDVVPEDVHEALRGSIVAIVVIKHGSPLYGLEAAIDEAQISSRIRIHVPHTLYGRLPDLVYGDHDANPLDPKTTECIGLGLVVGDPTEKGQLHIRSPVSEARIEAEVAQGHRMALVVARQQGSSLTSDSILGREQQTGRARSRSRENMAVREHDDAESLSSDEDEDEDYASGTDRPFRRAGREWER